ncbi:MAG: hypothetical protein WCC30_06830 [Candidatus Dormiibacterota bacterium]
MTDIYRPDQWHDYFITVGGASAALTGLVFVAMSLNPGVIAQDQTHRRRAVGTLAGFTAIFVICALGVMGGQDHRAIGLEWLTVSAVATVVYVYGYIQAIRFGGSSSGYDLIGLSVARRFTSWKSWALPCCSAATSPACIWQRFR